MGFANQRAFDAPQSRQMAMGVDLRPANAITDARGQVLAYQQTGGMLAPARHELKAGDHLFRFGAVAAGAQRVATGGWWLDRDGFATIERFAQVWDLSLGMAMRMLCLVPPEWSDASLLIRARVAEPLLAWRGLANSVITPAAGPIPGNVRMPHQNDIAARRLHQLFVPGLADAPAALRVEASFPLDPAAGTRGFLYL